MRLNHIGIKCSNQEESLKFYTGVLGFEKLYELEVMGKSCVFVGNDSVEIELEPTQSASGAPEVPPAFGLTHVAFKVDDIDAVAGELKDRGGRFLIPPFKIRETRKTGFLKAPDGVLIQLIQDFSGG